MSFYAHFSLRHTGIMDRIERKCLPRLTFHLYLQPVFGCYNEFQKFQSRNAEPEYLTALK